MRKVEKEKQITIFTTTTMAWAIFTKYGRKLDHYFFWMAPIRTILQSCYCRFKSFFGNGVFISFREMSSTCDNYLCKMYHVQVLPVTRILNLWNLVVIQLKLSTNQQQPLCSSNVNRIFNSIQLARESKPPLILTYKVEIRITNAIVNWCHYYVICT